jgi:hypothetical protein
MKILDQLFSKKDEHVPKPIYWAPGFEFPKIRSEAQRQRLIDIASTFKSKIDHNDHNKSAEYCLNKIKQLPLDQIATKYVAWTVVEFFP